MTFQKYSVIPRSLVWAFTCCLILLSVGSQAHLSNNRFEALIGGDSIAAVETYLEASTGMDVTVTAYGTLDWALDGIGVGVSISGNLNILVQNAADLDLDGFPFFGFWEYNQPFPPKINYMVSNFDASSPIGVQHALYAHDAPGNDIFSSGWFQTGDFQDGSGNHGWTDFSIYSVEFTPDGDLAPRGAIDDAVASGDVLICQQILLGIIEPTTLEVAHGDLHPVGAPDGKITAGDCLLIQRTALMQ